MSKIEVNEIDAQSGTTITVGSACKSVAVPGNVVKTNAVQASDGGNILFDSYDAEKKLVKVILQGACSGCPSSTVTLKNGIENMLKEMLSENVNSVEAING